MRWEHDHEWWVGKIWKEMVVAYSKVLSYHSATENEDNNGNTSQDSR
jgi:hypothetical protein